MEKEARKRSADPVQEHLREHKQIWNAEVSQLISEMIAFKRGINGKEVPDMGIPGSNIKDPFPPQISSKLSEIASHYSQILEGARSIIDEQAQYSEHRHKPHLASFESELEKQASWFGSRALARLKFLELERRERIIRSRLLVAGAELVEDLKIFEEKAADRSGTDIREAFLLFNIVLDDFQNILIPLVNKLGDVKQIPLATEEESQFSLADFLKSTSDISAEVKEVLFQFINYFPSFLNLISILPKLDLDAKEADLIMKRFSVLNNLFAKIKSKPNLVDITKTYTAFLDFKNMLSKHIDVLRKFEPDLVAALWATSFEDKKIEENKGANSQDKVQIILDNIEALTYLAGLLTDDSSPLNMEEKTDVAMKFTTLKNALNKIYPELKKPTAQSESKFTKIVEQFTAVKDIILKHETIIHSLNPNLDLSFMKEAALPTRWLRNQKLKLFENKQTIQQLEIIEFAKSIRIALSKFMDLIEDSGAHYNDISSALYTVRDMLVNLAGKVLLLGDSYTLKKRIENKNTNSRFREIPDQDLRHLIQRTRSLAGLASPFNILYQPWTERFTYVK